MVEDLSGFSMLELFRLEADTQTAVLSAAVLAIEELEHSPAARDSEFIRKVLSVDTDADAESAE